MGQLAALSVSPSLNFAEIVPLRCRWGPEAFERSNPFISRIIRLRAAAVAEQNLIPGAFQLMIAELFHLLF